MPLIREECSPIECRQARLRRGSSYLEVQVAFVIFSLGVGGLIPLTVVNSRQLTALRQQLPANETHYLNPPAGLWTAKLGASATVDSNPNTPPPPPNGTVQTIDQLDPGFSYINADMDDWWTISSGAAYLNEQLVNYPEAAGDVATWAFTSVASKKYQVLATWAPYSFLATDAEYEIYDGATLLGQVVVNQEAAPSGPSYQGTTWQSLGEFVVSSGSLIVKMRDNANDYVAMDAITIQPVENTIDLIYSYRYPQHSMVITRVESKP